MTLSRIFLWGMPLWAMILILVSPRLFESDDPGWVTAFFLALFSGIIFRRKEPKAARFCLIFALVFAVVGLILPMLAKTR